MKLFPVGIAHRSEIVLYIKLVFCTRNVILDLLSNLIIYVFSFNCNFPRDP